MTEATTRPPYQMSERELVVRFLNERADFWGKYPQHRSTERVLRNEAHLIKNGHHAKHEPKPNS